MKRTLAILGAAALGVGIPSTSVNAGGIGCEVILCISVGFAADNCGPAQTHFNSQMRKKHPKPFKPCKKESAQGVLDEYDVPAEMGMRTTPAYCSGGYTTTYGKEGGTSCNGGMVQREEHYVRVSIPQESIEDQIPGYTAASLIPDGLGTTEPHVVEYVWHSRIVRPHENNK